MRKEAAKWQEMEETRVFLETQVAQSRFAKQQEATRADSLAAQVWCHPARPSTFCRDPILCAHYCAGAVGLAHLCVCMQNSGHQVLHHCSRDAHPVVVRLGS